MSSRISLRFLFSCPRWRYYLPPRRREGLVRIKELMQIGVLFAVLGTVAVVVGLAYGLVVVSIVLTAIGNLAIWPMAFMAAFGFHWSFGTILGIATLMLIAIALFAPQPGSRAADKIGAIFALIMGTIMILFFLAVAVFTVLLIAAGVLYFLFGLELGYWPFVFIGAAVVLFYFAWNAVRNRKRLKQNPS
jgi:hypothetical protein